MRRTLRRKTPIRALVEGIIAGAIGAGVQSLFFRATAKVTVELVTESATRCDRANASGSDGWRVGTMVR